ncbi:Tad domain-containing protein [Pontibacterium granulatum]|uniref:Tad domain-containing protein n=1 Tax=Pontibacterium granulatum TaxID=2036029 RepID=UPI00249A8368|nr:Tad domain-containing protein [Pontibacterium granulatum]MDI3323800.1 Tad domain-containing protein [Pontibacterium granulatum]
MVILAIGMLALIAMSGLALDSGHIYLTKTRLQNAVDAAALGAAQELGSSSDRGAATTQANVVFSDNMAAPGNGLLADAWADGAGEITLTVEFSDTIDPFVPTTVGDPPYVRVNATGFTLDSWLVRVVGVNEAEVVASAVAGPSAGLTGVCNIAPIMACGCTPGVGGCCDPVSGCSGDDYLEDSFPTALPAAGELTVDQVTGLSLPAGTTSELGPGNFQLLRLGDSVGSNDLRNALAGNSDFCVDVGESGDWVDTEPGASVDAVSTGLNSRFDGSTRFDVPADYLKEELLEAESDKLVIVEDADGNPQVETESGNPPPSGGVYDYAQYATDMASITDADCSAVGGVGCEKWRRMMVLPIGNCDGSINGTSSPVQIHAYGCFMLLQRIDHTGQRAVFGQFVPNPGGDSVPGCDATGGIDPDPSEYAPTKIVLYRNADSGDS